MTDWLCSEGAVAAPTTETWGYAFEKHPERWMGSCDSREEAIEEATSQLAVDVRQLTLHEEIWITRGSPRKASSFVLHADRVIEHMGENAYDDGAAEDPSDWPDVTDEAKAELNRLLREWADRHCPEPLWCADGEPERIWPPPGDELPAPVPKGT